MRIRRSFIASSIVVLATAAMFGAEEEAGVDLAGEIAFMRDRKVWVVDPATAVERLLTDRTDYNRPIIWSPDGERLLFWDHSEIGWDFWTVHADGTNLRQLTATASGGYRSATYSPDGSLIAYLRDDPEGVFIMHADGTNQQRLSDHGHRDEPPSFSPDGRQLVFFSYGRKDRNQPKGLYVVSADVAAEKMTETFFHEGDSASWSPVDRRILFLAPGTGGDDDVYVQHPDRSDQENLTRSVEREYFPTWSPDGSTIAFARERSERVYDLCLMPSVGGDERALATIHGRLLPPVWSPGGAHIAYLSDAEEEQSLLVVDRQDGKSRMIARGPAWFAAWRPTPPHHSPKNRPEETK